MIRWVILKIVHQKRWAKMRATAGPPCYPASTWDYSPRATGRSSRKPEA